MKDLSSVHQNTNWLINEISTLSSHMLCPNCQNLVMVLVFYYVSSGKYGVLIYTFLVHTCCHTCIYESTMVRHQGSLNFTIQCCAHTSLPKSKPLSEKKNQILTSKPFAVVKLICMLKKFSLNSLQQFENESFQIFPQDTIY